MKIARSHAGTNVRKQPAAHGVVNLSARPMAFFWWTPRSAFLHRSQQFRPLGKNWIGKSLWLSDRLQPWERSRGLGEETMQWDIEPEARSLCAFLFDLHLYPRKDQRNQ